MSSDQVALEEFVTAKDIADDVNVPAWSPRDKDEFSKKQCQHCGNAVTEQYRRVFGGNDDLVHGCPDCKTFREIHDGGVANEF